MGLLTLRLTTVLPWLAGSEASISTTGCPARKVVDRADLVPFRHLWSGLTLAVIATRWFTVSPQPALDVGALEHHFGRDRDLSLVCHLFRNVVAVHRLERWNQE